MAKQSNAKKKLTFVDIVMNAEAEVIKQAYEARIQVDDLLAEREEAYRKIAQLEEQIEEVVGDEGVFVFPPPPCPVAGLENATPKRKKTKPATARSSSAKSAQGKAAAPDTPPTQKKDDSAPAKQADAAKTTGNAKPAEDTSAGTDTQKAPNKSS